MLTKCRTLLWLLAGKGQKTQDLCPPGTLNEYSWGGREQGVDQAGLRTSWKRWWPNTSWRLSIPLLSGPPPPALRPSDAPDQRLLAETLHLPNLSDSNFLGNAPPWDRQTDRHKNTHAHLLVKFLSVCQRPNSNPNPSTCTVIPWAGLHSPPLCSCHTPVTLRGHLGPSRSHTETTHTLLYMLESQ